MTKQPKPEQFTMYADYESACIKAGVKPDFAAWKVWFWK